MWLNLQTQNWRFREGHKNGHTCRFWLIIEAASSARREEQDCKVPEPGSKYARFLRGRKIAILAISQKSPFGGSQTFFQNSAENISKVPKIQSNAVIIRFMHDWYDFKRFLEKHFLKVQPHENDSDFEA